MLPAPLNLIFSVSGTHILGLRRLTTRWVRLNLVQTFSSPTNAYVEFIKTKLKLGRLLQHVSVYKETIIREPVSA